MVLLLALLLALLLVHLVGMVHSEGMTMGGTCLFLLLGPLLIFAPRLRWRLPAAVAVREDGSRLARMEPECRAPPSERSLESIVLIC